MLTPGLVKKLLSSVEIVAARNAGETFSDWTGRLRPERSSTYS